MLHVQQPFSQERVYYPFIGPFDPCPPIREKSYVVPPNQFVVYQPAGLPQFSPAEALRSGTLWPLFFSPYAGKK
ncbi:MAG TPA: spore coat associated protein CotJA [Bacilli bacterium]